MTNPIRNTIPLRTANGGRPPVVGISGESIESSSVQHMMTQVRAAGGIPMLLANHSERNAAEDIAKIDTLVVMGSDRDVDPARYVGRYAEGDPRRAIHPQTQSSGLDATAKAREAYEVQLLTLAAQQKMPTLTVCRGTQLLNVMHGGGLLQHIPDQIGDNHHAQSTLGLAGICAVVPVTIDGTSAMGAIAGGVKTIFTGRIAPAPGDVGSTENSFHHQAIDPDLLGTGLRISAVSDSYKNTQGEARCLPEAIEPDPTGPLAAWPMMGVQWHPEFAPSNLSTALIAHTVAQGAEYTKTSTRDASFDGAAAMAANLRSSRRADQPFVEMLANRIPGQQQRA